MRLSELQKAILLIAIQSKGGRLGRVDVTPADVKRTYYGFPCHPGRAIHFSRVVVGVARYKAASVSITKAFDRLTERGLTERHYGYGVKLTPEGEKVAANFLALQKEDCEDLIARTTRAREE